MYRVPQRDNHLSASGRSSDATSCRHFESHRYEDPHPIPTLIEEQPWLLLAQTILDRSIPA
jgi:hypothetical protein